MAESSAAEAPRVGRRMLHLHELTRPMVSNPDYPPQRRIAVSTRHGPWVTFDRSLIRSRLRDHVSNHFSRHPFHGAPYGFARVLTSFLTSIIRSYTHMLHMVAKLTRPTIICSLISPSAHLSLSQVNVDITTLIPTSPTPVSPRSSEPSNSSLPTAKIRQKDVRYVRQYKGCSRP